MVADNFEDLVTCGYLDMKLPRKQRKLGRQVWKQKWFILRRKSCQGLPRIEYHKSEESCLRQQNKTVINLKGLLKIEENTKSKTRKKSLKLVFSDTFLMLAHCNMVIIKEWFRLIQRLVLPAPHRSLRSRLDGCYPVTVIHTEDSEKLNLVGEYLMIVTMENLTLYRNDENLQRSTGTVIKWDLDDIPRFRLQKLNHLNDSEKIFIVNVARTSQTCEGEFHFLTESGRQLLETVKSQTKQRCRVNDDSPRSTPEASHVHVSNTTLESNNQSCSSSTNSELSYQNNVDHLNL